MQGEGGGYDISHGIPFYFYLAKTLNKQVILANFSFTELEYSQSEEVFEGTYHITHNSLPLNYFPELEILQWLKKQHHIEVPMYAFSNELGVQPLRAAYNHLIAKHQIDTVLLVDGGTDSIIFGDEKGLGTIVEYANSMIAVAKANVAHTYLAAVGFGIDHFHDVNHYNFLENVAALIKDGGYLGAFSITQEMVEGKEYLALSEHLANNKTRPSIVNTCIAGALKGDFGDVHYSKRTQNSQLFINPLMPLYWTFNLADIVKHMEFANMLENTRTIQEVTSKIHIHRIYKNGKYRYRQSIPL